MAYVAPTVRTTGDLITASIWNADIVNNIQAIVAGLIGVGFAAVDLVGAAGDPSVSAAGHAVIALNTTTGTVRQSISGGAFTDLGNPANYADAILAAEMML